MDKKVVKLGFIGMGGRSRFLMKAVFLQVPDVEIAAVCDLYQEPIDEALKVLEELGQPTPKTFNDYHELLKLPEVDAVVVITTWETHVKIACDAMRAGKPVAFEVGGASSLEECWKLVRTYEETGVPCFFMENCCYGREELMLLNMARQNMFGEIVHCRGGYFHELRGMQTSDRESGKNFRFINATHRNGETYPTHELGPIANILNINRGNRMVSLTSMASKAAGLATYIREQEPENRNIPVFTQGDVVTTMIKCATGETIVLSLQMSLPQYYSRGLCVRGTKGMYEGENRSVFLDGDGHDRAWRECYNNVDEYMEKYDHPLWKGYKPNEAQSSGHGGVDWLMGKAFIDAVRDGKPMPIDAYDAAAWMSITCLSEQSIAMGSMPVAIPDFTCGNWMYRKPWEPEA